MKRKIFLAIFSLFSTVFAQKFQIAQVEYNLEFTKEKALEHKVPVDKKTIFSREGLESYRQLLIQELNNTRAFETVEVTFSDFDEPTAEDSQALLSEKDEQSESATQVLCRIDATESKHLLIVPYPKYDSNSGLMLKLKAKDTNFLGNLEELNFDFNLGNKLSEIDEQKGFFAGAELSVIYPFYTDFCNVYWKNNYSFEYNFHDEKPQFATSTGIAVEKPFDRFSLLFEIYQSAFRNFEYIKYEDELYYNTYTKFSVPVKIFQSSRFGNLIYSPFADYDYNIDHDRINPANDDLSGAVFAAGNEISLQHINWAGNFRNGYDFTAGHKYGYNYQTKDFQHKIYGDARLFKAFRYNSISTKVSFNYSDRYREKIGHKIRGVMDDQKYKGTKNKALKVPSSIIVNADFPVHAITTDWEGWIQRIFGEDSWMAEHFGWTRTFNFELQISPFFDAALVKNEANGRLFSCKDGWYAGGIEFLVYPEKWKSVVVRASAGIDLGRKILKEKFPDKIDYSWREDVSAHEIYIGIGLQY